MEKNSKRNAIFISHATPGDNAFAIWLATHLAMAGYEVWCDQEKLIAGEDFWKDIESALRSNAIKFILVVSSNAFNEDGSLKDGISKEIAVANILKKKLKDEYFVMPMRIDSTSYDDFGIDFIRLNGIDCKANWAAGYSILLKALERDKVPCSDQLVEPSLSSWRKVHQIHGQAITDEIELLQSNWISIEDLPSNLNFYNILKSIKISEPRGIASSCELPCFDHGRLLVSFADTLEFQAALGDKIPIEYRGTLKTMDFLQGRTNDILGISRRDAQYKLTSLVRQAWNRTLVKRGLVSYEMANQRLAWWFPKGIPEDGKLRYKDFNGKPRYRAVSGYKGKKEMAGAGGEMIPKYYWHLGFTGKPFIAESSFIFLQPRIIISEDGKTPLENKAKLNSVRRSLTNMWFNEKWRGLVLGFVTWLANGNKYIELEVAKSITVKLNSKPVTFQAPVAIKADAAISNTTEEEEKNERNEMLMRLNDPLYGYRNTEEDLE